MAVNHSNKIEALKWVKCALESERKMMRGIALDIVSSLIDQEKMELIIEGIPPIATPGGSNEVIPEDGGDGVDSKEPHRNFPQF